MDTAALFQDDGALAAELGWVRGLAARLVADPNDAEDVAQEAWLKARSAPRGFESLAGMRAWLAAVTRRLARDTRRAERRRAGREACAARAEATAAEDEVVQDVVGRSEAAEAVLAALRELEEPYRSTVLLRHMDGRSTAEIARLTQVTEALVRKRLSRGLARLRRCLERRFGSEFRACLLALAGQEPAAGLALAAKLALAASLAGLALVGVRARVDPPTLAAPAVVTDALEVVHAAGEHVALESARSETTRETTRQPLAPAPSAGERRADPAPVVRPLRGVRDYRFADDGRGNVQELELELVPPSPAASDGPPAGG